MPGQRRIFVFNPSGNGNGWWIDFARSQNWTINIEKDLQRAESELNAQRPDVLALNYGLNELQFCSRVRANDSQSALPIVFYSDRPLTREEKIKALKAGADEFMSAPLLSGEFLARMGPFLKESPLPVPKTILANRLLNLLIDPQRAFQSIDGKKDLTIALGLVLLTPLVAGTGMLANNNFDTWLGALALGLVTNAIMWTATAASLYLALPFNGHSVSLRHAFLLTGFGWAPRLLGAVLGTFYYFAGALFVASPHFSAGLDLLPLVPSGPSLLFNIGLFDVWCAGVTVAGVRAHYGFEKRWNTTTLSVCAVCVIIGILAPY